jgi:hypothetical protein
VMRIETQGLKNKVVKTQGLKRCLTLNFLILKRGKLHHKVVVHSLATSVFVLGLNCVEG